MASEEPAGIPASAPVLSTPDTHIFNDASATHLSSIRTPRQSDEERLATYEIQRTVTEIRAGGWKRIALQFPDHMLPDAPWVYKTLANGLEAADVPASSSLSRHPAAAEDSQAAQPEVAAAKGVDSSTGSKDAVSHTTNQLAIATPGGGSDTTKGSPPQPAPHASPRLFILADTSYGACCVDEVAAEHASADVVVHYGRSCLSPTARLPVIYVFTRPPLELDLVVSSFEQLYPSRDAKVVLMADLPYCSYIDPLAKRLTEQKGYTALFATEIKHDTSSLLPNRTTPPALPDATAAESLRQYSLFHISEPPASLLLTLSSRLASIHVYPTSHSASSLSSSSSMSPPTISPTSTAILLRRRYALLTSLTTVPVWGILINTLSVANYLAALSHLKQLIARAGKKSYTFVVGKVNAAKVANFAEVGGWVVVGCWESSLFEGRDLWKPVITPFELELALQGDEQRVWTGEWNGDFQALLNGDDQDGTNDRAAGATSPVQDAKAAGGKAKDGVHDDVDDGRNEYMDDDEVDGGDGRDSDEEEEDDDEPPEFDLRTGRYVSRSRPMMQRRRRRRHRRPSGIDGGGDGKAGAQQVKENEERNDDEAATTTTTTKALARRARHGELTANLGDGGGGVLAWSPAARFFREQRSWQGLGSDFAAAAAADGEGDGHEVREEEEQGAPMEEGRRGIARGYVVGEGTSRR